MFSDRSAISLRGCVKELGTVSLQVSPFFSFLSPPTMSFYVVLHSFKQKTSKQSSVAIDLASLRQGVKPFLVKNWRNESLCEKAHCHGGETPPLECHKSGLRGTLFLAIVSKSLIKNILNNKMKPN